MQRGLWRRGTQSLPGSACARECTLIPVEGPQQTVDLALLGADWPILKNELWIDLEEMHK